MIFIPERPEKPQKTRPCGNQISKTSPSHLPGGRRVAVEADHSQAANHHARSGSPENCEQREILRVKQDKRCSGYSGIEFIPPNVTSQHGEQREHAPVAEQEQRGVQQRRAAPLCKRSNREKRSVGRIHAMTPAGWPIHFERRGRDLMYRDRNLITLRALLPQAFGPRGRRLRSGVSCRIRAFHRGNGHLFERQRGLQVHGRDAVPPDTIVLESAGHFAPPFRFEGQVALGVRRHTTSRRVPSGSAQGRITNRANFGGIAVHGAALPAGFYHRSVLRCGCLAERKSGVTCILTAVRRRGQKCFELSRNGYPRQPPGHEPESIDSGMRQSEFFRRGAKPSTFL